MRELVSFLRKPQLYRAKIKTSIAYKLKVIFGLFLISLLLTLLTFYPASLIGEHYSIAKGDIFKVFGESILFQSKYGILIFVVLIVPIYEEFATRLFLKYSRTNIFISFIVNMGLCFLFFSKEIAIVIILVFSLIFGALFLLKNRFVLLEKIKALWELHFSYVFYFSVLLFVFYHALGYAHYGMIKSLVVLMLMLPKAVTGSLIGYVRVRFGFVWGVFFHIILNLFSSAYLIITMF